MKIDGNEIKVGNILEINKKLWRVLKTQHTQPGKGGAYIQAELKEIKEGTKMNSRFRSSESIERAIMDEKEFQYLYNENEKFFFMDQQTYEQIELGSDIISHPSYITRSCAPELSISKKTPRILDSESTGKSETSIVTDVSNPAHVELGVLMEISAVEVAF